MLLIWQQIILSSKTTVLLCLLLLCQLLWNCCTILALPIESEIMDGFWWFRCLNDRIDLPDMIGSFASGTTASMVAKSGTKKIIPLLWIKSSPVEGFWCLRCLNDSIEVPDMIGSFASSATASLTSGQILMFEVSKQLSWHKYSYQTKLNRFGLAIMVLFLLILLVDWSVPPQNRFIQDFPLIHQFFYEVPRIFLYWFLHNRNFLTIIFTCWLV